MRQDFTAVFRQHHGIGDEIAEVVAATRVGEPGVRVKDHARLQPARTPRSETRHHASGGNRVGSGKGERPHLGGVGIEGLDPKSSRSRESGRQCPLGIPLGSPGPAVYIIHKKEEPLEAASDEKADATIPVKFYSY